MLGQSVDVCRDQLLAESLLIAVDDDPWMFRPREIGQGQQTLFWRDRIAADTFCRDQLSMKH